MMDKRGCNSPLSLILHNPTQHIEVRLRLTCKAVFNGPVSCLTAFILFSYFIPLRFSPRSRFALQSAHTRPLIYNKFVLLLTSSFGCRKKRFKAEIQVRYHDQDTAVRRSEKLITGNGLY